MFSNNQLTRGSICQCPCHGRRAANKGCYSVSSTCGG